MTDNFKDDRVNSQRGPSRSYVIGFVLSLIFTIIPYYMARAEIAGDKTLLLAILGFAILQMFVQIFFFLHLGRGPKPLYNVVFFAATAGLIVLVIGASLLIMDNLYRNMSPTEATTRLAQDENIAAVSGKLTGACQGNNDNHIVVIEGDVIRSGHIEAKRCDTLTLTNNDENDRKFSFTSQGSSVSYGGVDEVVVKHGKSKIITLNETGEFNFRDSTDHGIMGSFSVTP